MSDPNDWIKAYPGANESFPEELTSDNSTKWNIDNRHNNGWADYQVVAKLARRWLFSPTNYRAWRASQLERKSA